jgi:hypothetical protein
MNLQVIASQDGEILCVSGALPGALHDLTAARIWGIARELAASELIVAHQATGTVQSRRPFCRASQAAVRRAPGGPELAAAGMARPAVGPMPELRRCRGSGASGSGIHFRRIRFLAGWCVLAARHPWRPHSLRPRA